MIGCAAALGVSLIYLPFIAIATGGLVGVWIKKGKFVDNDYISVEEAGADLRKWAAILCFDDLEKITPQNLRHHYRYLSKQYHPDKPTKAPIYSFHARKTSWMCKMHMPISKCT
jgi:hypothetical protein